MPTAAASCVCDWPRSMLRRRRANDRQAEACGCVDGRIGVPKIVHPQLGEPGGTADAPPGTLHVGPVRSLALARKDGRVPGHPGDAGEDHGRGSAQRHALRAGLGVGEVQGAALEVDALPAQGEDLGLATVGQNQQTNRGDHRPWLGAGGPPRVAPLLASPCLAARWGQKVGSVPDLGRRRRARRGRATIALFRLLPSR
jgi:hypothetical protein